MPFATLVPALLEALQAAPSIVGEVEALWASISAVVSPPAEHDDAVTAAVATAKAT
jgi:hypothetical protein